MNPYKAQSIKITADFELNKISKTEIKVWIEQVLLKTENKEPWMTDLLLACDCSKYEILRSLNSIPFDHSGDELWEKMVRLPLITKS